MGKGVLKNWNFLLYNMWTAPKYFACALWILTNSWVVHPISPTPDPDISETLSTCKMQDQFTRVGIAVFEHSSIISGVNDGGMSQK